MKKWIIRPHRSSPYMLAFEKKTKSVGYYFWTKHKNEALKFDKRMDAVQVANENQRQYAVMEIEI